MVHVTHKGLATGANVDVFNPHSLLATPPQFRERFNLRSIGPQELHGQINVTQNPTAQWIARQITEVFPWDEAPGYLIRDHDQIHGNTVPRRMRAGGIRDGSAAPASPWQNGFSELLIGSIRRECLDHLVVLNEAHLARILQNYVDYYNNIRTQRSPDKDAPAFRPVEQFGKITSQVILGALPLCADLSFWYAQSLPRSSSAYRFSLMPNDILQVGPQSLQVGPQSGWLMRICEKINRIYEKHRYI